MNFETSRIKLIFSKENLFLLLAAGGIGEIALEFFAWWILPAILGRPMRPDILVADLARSLFDMNISVVLGVSIHLALGLFIFPVIFAMARAIIGFHSTLMPAAVFGVILWLIAQTTLAPLAGRPFMLGLIPYTWASLVAHILYTVVIAVSYDKLSHSLSHSGR